LGEHAEVVRVVFDPTSNALHKLLSVVVSWLPPRAERTGQYRNLISVGHTSQAAHVEEILKTVDALARPEVLLPGEPRSRFWPAEDYHQKHRLRRNKGLVTILEEEFGMRWDEHLFVTKLNAGGTRGFDLAPWLAKVSVRVATAYRKGA
jgi:peptide-methionine (S)-S-oxide reductase